MVLPTKLKMCIPEDLGIRIYVVDNFIYVCKDIHCNIFQKRHWKIFKDNQISNIMVIKKLCTSLQLNTKQLGERMS